MPVSDLGTDELALTGRITTAYKATFLGIIGGAAVRIHIREAERDDEDL